MQFAYAASEGAEVVQAGEVDQAPFVGAPVVAAAPARVNVSPEVFAKLVAGGQLTPDEMAQLGGEPTPGQQSASPVKQPTPEAAPQTAGAVPGSTEAADKSDEKDKSGSKSLKASKKKNKGCC